MNKGKYYQAKYEYYRSLHLWIIIAACVSSIFYFISDCALCGGFNYQTLIPRLSIIIPLIIFIVCYKHTKDYRIMITLGFVVSHCVMFCTIWACYYLEDLSFACAGFLIINVIFLALGIASPVKGLIFAHGLLFADITFANTFLHYPDFGMMLMLGIPLYCGICVFDIAIEKTFRDQLNIKRQLEFNIKHDAMTGAYNRNIISSLADNNNVLSDFKPHQSGVIMYDIDFFKKVNDTYGHSTGDQVLIKTAAAIQSVIDEDSFLIRWGGEEFIILAHGNPESLNILAEKIRATVEKLELDEVGHVTISVGVAEYDGCNCQNTISNADAALYEAKNNGRNRVAVFS